MIRRSGVESEVSSALREYGISVLIGASGFGKSIVARAVAGETPRGFTVADFRNADSEESRHRLDISQSVLTADTHTLDMLAEHLYLLRFARVDKPLYPDDPTTSWILKLAQFRLAAAANDRQRVSDIETALSSDVASLPSAIRDSLEVLAALVVLSTVGVANYLDNWPSLLQRLKYLIENNGFLQASAAKFEENSGLSLFGGLFSIGIANLSVGLGLSNGGVNKNDLTLRMQ